MTSLPHSVPFLACIHSMYFVYVYVCLCACMCDELPLSSCTYAVCLSFLQLFDPSLVSWFDGSGRNRILLVRLLPYACLCLSGCPSVSLSVCLCVALCMFVSLTCFSISWGKTFMSVCISVHLTAYLCVCLSACLCLYVCVFVRMLVAIAVSVCFCWSA